MPVGLLVVLVVCDQIPPRAFGTGFRAFPDGQVRHEVVLARSMPVPLTRWGVGSVAGSQDDNVAAAGLHQPDALGHVQRLANGVRVPGGFVRPGRSARS
jgi:hypothetical protein